MSRYLNIIILVIFCLLLSAGLFLLNELNLDIRLMELKQYLQKNSAEENSSIDHMGLVMKYRISTMRYDNKISMEEADIMENNVNLLVSAKEIEETVKDDDDDAYASLIKPALYVINVNRYFIGKPAITTDSNMDSIAYLEIAYYYERNNHYKKSLEYYKKVVSLDLPKGPLAAGIMLHQGFCNALLGNYDRAKDSYIRVIKEYPGQPITFTATILLNYLVGFHEEYKRILKSKDSISKGVKLHNLMAYKEALRVLRKVEKTASPKQMEKIKYYKALVLRETGKTQKAVDRFLEIISRDPKSKYARSANRKIYLIASRLGRNNKLKKVAIRTNLVIKDKILDRMIRDEALIRGDRKPAPEINSGHNTIKGDASGLEKVTIKKSSLKIIDQKELLEKMMDEPEKLLNSLSGKKKQRVLIIDKDDNIFIGIARKAGKDTIIMDTDLGKIKIHRSKIKSMKVFSSFQIIDK